MHPDSLRVYANWLIQQRQPKWLGPARKLLNIADEYDALVPAKFISVLQGNGSALAERERTLERRAGTIIHIYDLPLPSYL